MASLVVPCPKCTAKLAAPESAVGKQIRCPKCGAIATVPNIIPAEEVPVVEAKVAAKPKPKPVQAEADDEDERPRKKSRRDEEEDEADEDDRPRRKKKRYVDEDDDYDHDRRKKRPRRKSGGGGALVAGLIVGGLLLVCVGIGIAVYAFSGKGSFLAKKSPVPPGWEEYRYPQDGFKLYAPKGVSHTSEANSGFRPGQFGGAGPWFGENEFGNLPPVERIAFLNSTTWNESPQVMVYVIKFRDRLPSSVRDAFRRAPTNAQFGGMEMRTVKWLGQDAMEQAHTNSATRVVYTDRYAVIATISGPNMGRAKPEEEAAFFDNFELTN